MKIAIENWYKTNINDKGYTKYLDQNTVWCNNRSITSGSLLSKGEATSSSTDFSSSARTSNPTVKETIACSNLTDRFTARNSNTGNKLLTYPVGMLTVDEVTLAGMGFGSSKASSDSYLYTGYNYWTMSPHSISVSGSMASGNFISETRAKEFYSYNFAVTSTGYSQGYSSDSSFSIRPVISLNAETWVYGNSDGTKEKPYEVIME